MSTRTVLRRAARPPARLGLRGLAALRTRGWASVSRLFVVGEGTGWSVDEDARHLEGAARRLGYETGRSEWAPFAHEQAVFLTSHFSLLGRRWLDSSHRLGVAYLHGRPGTAGMPEFDAAYASLRHGRERIARVRVTHTEMHELVLEAGVEPSCVFQIPLGVDLERFPLGDAEARTRARAALGLPASAFVVGSFQKDGVGWGEGLEPKLIKGPDVLVEALELLSARVSELWVLLTGPARGYVRRELERRGVPYRHVQARSRDELASAYHALDVYLVASRQEGGPKAVLEAMASGVPLITTGVGQARELVAHGRNGLLVDVEDSAALAESAARIAEDAGLVASLRREGRATAERLTLESFDPLWAELLAGFVSKPNGRSAG